MSRENTKLEDRNSQADHDTPSTVPVNSATASNTSVPVEATTAASADPAKVDTPQLSTGESALDDQPSTIVAEDPAAIVIRSSEEAQPATDPGSSATSLPLLLEVGCEEIPARFLRAAEKELGERVHAALREARIVEEAGLGVLVEAPGSGLHIELSSLPGADLGVTTYSTPRRLVVHVPNVLTQQPDKVEEILGPPVKVAIDAEGNYTRAGESFAQKNSARTEDLTRTTTPKGEYLSLKKTTAGRPATAILGEILPAAILGISFPKSMYWTTKQAPRFVRPIRWIVALLGEGEQAVTLNFEILGVKAGNFTYGHRAKSRAPIPVNGLKDYTRKLRQSHVLIDYSQRKRRIAKESQLVLAGTGNTLIADDWLADWIANSTEWPRPLLGSFDARFLHLPREILITVMRDHQRYFAIESVGPGSARPNEPAGASLAARPPELRRSEIAGTPEHIDGQTQLAPHFVAVLNMDSDEKGLIRQGHQRVLTARFRDAEFFWTTDQRVPLRDRGPLLEKVTYQEKLGSYGEKIRRMKVLAENLCTTLEASGRLQTEHTAHVLRAVELCKCDLTTQMVQEFTELQGIVGGLYTKAQGEPEEVAAAVYDHYLPLGAEGTSPRTLVGCAVSLADKLDSVVAGFAVGYDPTGSSDPFALRRQANGIIKVILDNKLSIDLEKMVDNSISVLEIQWRKPRPEVRARVLEFLGERLRYFLEAVRGFRYDTVRAVVAAGASRPADALARCEAMEALRGSDDFEALSAAAKRIRNILAKSATAADWEAGEVEASLLVEPEERGLYSTYLTVVASTGAVAQSSESTALPDPPTGEAAVTRSPSPVLHVPANYRHALEMISTLRPSVDRFFDKVLVMAEEAPVRQNRLRLLKKLDELFSGIAHFAEIAEKQ